MDEDFQGREKLKTSTLLPACLSSLRAGGGGYSTALRCPVSSAFQYGLKLRGFPGVLQAFNSRLGLLRHPASWIEETLGS